MNSITAFAATHNILTTLYAPPLQNYSISAGALYPAYQTYKAVHMGAQQDPRGDVRGRWLKYWAVFGALSVAERALLLER